MIILSVRPDPEPGDLVVLQKADGAISEGHAGGVDGVVIMNILEVEARVPGVLPEQPIRFLGKVSDLSSSSSHWAIRSCSSAGSVVSFAMAVSSARVIERSLPIPGRRGPTTGCSGGRQSAAAEAARSADTTHHRPFVAA